MKINRRRCHLRPRPSRAQIRQQINHLRHQIQLQRMEWLLEVAREERNYLHLRLLQHGIAACQDAIADWEAC
jgi:hypothetical protein